MRTDYRFERRWQVPAGTDAVRRLLEDVPGYGAWWRGVRVVADVSRDGRRAARLEVRAPAGYRIRITITEAMPDDGAAPGDGAAAGDPHELRARISGDLEGWCAWRFEAAPGGTRIAFVQQVEARALPLRLASPLLHGALAAQHGRMLRAAEAGMRAALAAR